MQYSALAKFEGRIHTLTEEMWQMASNGRVTDHRTLAGILALTLDELVNAAGNLRDTLVSQNGIDLQAVRDEKAAHNV